MLLLAAAWAGYRWWFDPARVREDYVPTGWRPFDRRSYAVKGHRFGLDLPEDERRALLAFLRTL